MRILHVLDHSLPLTSGYAVRAQRILACQAAAGHSAHALTGPKQGVPFSELESAGGHEYFRTPPVPAPGRRVPYLAEWLLMRSTTRRLLGLARELRPDVIHAHSPVLNAIPALRVGRALGLPVVYEVRAFWEDAAVGRGKWRPGGLRYRVSRRLETRAMKAADGVVAICEGLRDDIVARGIRPERVTVVRNAADPPEEGRGGAGPALAPPLGGKPVIGYFGSFYSYEGLDLLILAMPAILGRRPDAHVLLMGGGPEERRLRALAESLGLSGRVRFGGRVPPDRIGPAYRLVDVFVFPRRRMRLTDLVTPLKPIEALARGKPVAASDVGGHRELLAGEPRARLFAPDDVAALARGVLAALGAAGLPPRPGRDRSWAASVRGYDRVYGALGAGGGPACRPGPRAVPCAAGKAGGARTR